MDDINVPHPVRQIESSVHQLAEDLAAYLRDRGWMIETHNLTITTELLMRQGPGQPQAIDFTVRMSGNAGPESGA